MIKSTKPQSHLSHTEIKDLDTQWLTRQIELALEHFDEQVWLEKHSELVSPYFLGMQVLRDRKLAVGADGRGRALQEFLRKTINKAFTDQSNGSLGEFVQFIYLNRPNGLKQIEAAKQIGWAESTYAKKRKLVFQILTEAIQKDSREKFHHESTHTNYDNFVGRSQALQLALSAIDKRQILGIQGMGGIGKTTLGHVIAQKYKAQSPTHRPVFWYTFRPGLNDTLQSLMFSLGLFLQELGESAIWLHFCRAYKRQFSPEQPDYMEMGANLAIEMLQSSLSRLAQRNIDPLFILDEVDILRLNNNMHAIISTFVEGLGGENMALSVILIGQQVLLRHTTSLNLKGLEMAELSNLLQRLDIIAQPNDIQHLWEMTHGHPLMLRLFVNSIQRNQALQPQIAALTESPSLAMLWGRIKRNLSDEAISTTMLLAACQAPVPITNAHFPEPIRSILLDKDLVVMSPDGRMLLLNPTLRQMLYQQIPATDRPVLHLQAANLYQDVGEYTTAAYQYLSAGRPDMAIHLLSHYKKQEIANGQANTLLALLQTITLDHLSNPIDQQALALLRSELLLFSGDPHHALTTLNAVDYTPHSLAAGYAQRLRADTLAVIGKVDDALAQYRIGFDGLFELAGTQMMQISLRKGANYWHRLHDLSRAEIETRRARCQLEILEGNIRAYAGNNSPAITHYRTAIAYAEELGDEALQAAAHQELAHIAATNLDTLNAIGHYETCDVLFGNTGQQFCQWVNKGNMSYAYLCGQQYEMALPLAQETYKYMKNHNHHGYGAFFHAFSAATLAEIHYYLNQADLATFFANEAIGLEDEFYSPMAQYVFARIQSDKKQFEIAVEYCHQAIETLKDIQHADAWRVLARAYDALGDINHCAMRIFDAKRAFSQALTIYQQLGSKKECARIQQKINQFYALPQLAGS